jgi:hypothetical protein
MKKIIISALILANTLNLSAQETKDVHEIYCTPDIEKCIQNLNNLKNFINYDFSVSKEIPEHIFNEYALVIDYTTLSLITFLNKDTINIVLKEEVNFRK